MRKPCHQMVWPTVVGGQKAEMTGRMFAAGRNPLIGLLIAIELIAHFLVLYRDFIS